MPRAGMRNRRRVRYAGLSTKTIRAYRRAIDSYLLFCGKRTIAEQKPSHLDKRVGEFINHNYQEGEPLTQAISFLV